MAEFDRIAVINVGWSDDYRGSEPVGSFRHLKIGVGHERYNFLAGPDGKFFGYAPPLGEGFNPPKPDEPDDWLIFAVSKRPGLPGLYLVGWFENARFLCGYEARPDASALGLDTAGEYYGHTFVAPMAVAIPVPLRTRKIVGDHLKRSYAYLKGNGQRDRWRTQLAGKLLKYRQEYLAQDAASAGAVDHVPTSGISADTKRRKEVEEKSVNAVIAEFCDWDLTDRQKDKCGYDLLFRHRTSKAEMHIEVKGTQALKPHFFISKNELDYAERATKAWEKRKLNALTPQWQLAMVTDALRTPQVKLLDLADVKKRFLLEIYTWRGTIKA